MMFESKNHRTGQVLPGVRTQSFYPAIGDFDRCECPSSSRVECPFSRGLRCGVCGNRSLAVASLCLGCPYITELDRGMIRMAVRRKNRRDDAPLMVIVTPGGLA